MSWFDLNKVNAVPRSVGFRDAVYVPKGVAGESIRVGRG